MCWKQMAWEQKRTCSPKKSEVLLPEAGRMDFEQEKQQMSLSAAERFGQIKSFWEARHANQIKNRAASGMPACRRICSGESLLPGHSLCIFNATFFANAEPSLGSICPPLTHLSQHRPFSANLKAPSHTALSASSSLPDA